ncbi:CBS domain-containing protein [Spirillospora sp. CA-255316]
METTVKAVMTSDVVTVDERAPYKEVVEVLRHSRVSAVPVLGPDGQVAGIISTSDLIMKPADPAPAQGEPTFTTARRHSEQKKAQGATATELMSTPVRTITPGATVQAAAERMRRHRVGRLPVIDPVTGALVGIVSRSDVLRVYERPDEEIERDVRAEISGRDGGSGSEGITVTVSQGRVEVYGKVGLRSRIPALLQVVRRVEGVVSAYSHLEWRTDDLTARR